MKAEEVKGIIEKHTGERGELITILEDIQSKYSYLPQAALEEVSRQTGRSLVDIYGVATFYKGFSLKQRGRHLISCCVGTACHVRNAPTIVDEFVRQLKVQPGDTTPDREFTLETVNCLGACALGPIVVVDGHYFPNVQVGKVGEVLEKTEEGLDKVDVQTDKKVFPLEVSCSRCNHSLMEPRHLIDGFPPIKVTISFARTHGWLLISSIYGSYNIESNVEIPMDMVVDVFCPHCHGELAGGVDCADCGAPMVPMIVRGGGMVQTCSRRGCKGHMLDLDGVNF